MRISLQDVASRAGCSKMTVSLALRHSPRVAAVTGRRIRELAAAMGYRPDPALATIAAHRWRSRDSTSGAAIAYLELSTTDTTDNRRNFLGGVRAEAEAHGYVLHEIGVTAATRPDRLGRTLRQMGVQGVILGRAQSAVTLAGFPWADFSIVSFGQSLGLPRTHAVMPSSFRSVHRAWTLLRERGFRRIGGAMSQGLITESELEIIAVSRSNAAHQSRRLPVLSGEWHAGHAGMRTEFLRWLDRYRPDAVIGYHAGFYYWAGEHGIRLPEQLSMVCLNVNAAANPEVTGWDPGRDLLARTLVQVLAAAISRGERGIPDIPTITLRESRWQEGTSLGWPATKRRVRRDAPGPGRTAA